MIESIVTERLELSPTLADHDRAFAEALADESLYRFHPGEPLTAAQWRERLLRWEARVSPDEREHWWNWIAYTREQPTVVGHFQVSLDADGAATLGYVLSAPMHRRGYATEALTALVKWVLARPGCRMVRAQVDTRNTRSIALLERLGLNRISLIENADFFKGEPSDEWVYELWIR